jgi:UDP-N-acetyl-D-mannosaminuronate dehydrogenase
MVKVCVIGLGHVGIPTMEYISRFHNTYGFDKSYNKPFNDIPICDAYVVCVPTDQVSKVVHEIGESDALISIESTVPVGTCAGLSHKNYIVHCPHRWWNVDQIRYGVRQLRVIGGVDDYCLKRGIDFYQSMDIPVFAVEPIEVAEMSKVAENAYEYLRIAFAEDLAMKCQELKISFPMLRQAMNTNEVWKAVPEVREARDGIGGGDECLPMANEMLGTFLCKMAKSANTLYTVRRQNGI